MDMCSEKLIMHRLQYPSISVACLVSLEHDLLKKRSDFTWQLFKVYLTKEHLIYFVQILKNKSESFSKAYLS